MSDEMQLENSVTTEGATVDHAREYEDKRFHSSWRMRRMDRLEKAFARQLFEAVGPDACIVDIPCGTGRFFELFGRARMVVAADYSEAMLQVFRERHGSPANTQIIRADITRIPLADKTADLCFCMRLFHHMQNDDVRMASLRELARLSRKYVALSFYDGNCLRYRWRKALRKRIRGNYITYAHLRNLAEQVGLEPVGDLTRLSLFDLQSLATFRRT